MTEGEGERERERGEGERDVLSIYSQNALTSKFAMILKTKY